MYINLLKERKKQKLTVVDMGKLISKTPATYYKKEIGVVSTSVQEALKISKELGKPVEYLYQEFDIDEE